MRAAALASLLLVAGCLSPHDDGTGIEFTADWSERALVAGAGHDHTDAAQHVGLTTPNFEVLGFDPLRSDHYGMSAGSYHCGDARDVGGRRLAAVESRSKVGFAVADVTDATHPKWLGELVLENTDPYDLTITPDGRFIVLVTILRPRDAPALPLPLPLPAAGEADGARLLWTRCGETPQAVPFDDSTSDPVPRPRSILLVDIADPVNPVIVDQQPLAGDGHSVFAADLGGRTTVLAATLANPPLGGAGFEFYTIESGPVGARLVLQSRHSMAPTPLPVALGNVASHDGWLAVHPVTQKPMAYLAGGFDLVLLDLSDVTTPREVGRWSENVPGREGYSGTLHSVEPLSELWDGRHFTVLGPEWYSHPVDHPTGIIWVLDTTDPGNPFEVAAWTLPHEVDWTGEYTFSTHYFTTVGKTLFVSMYHGGVWAVDLAPVGSAPFVTLDSIGVFVPANPGLPPVAVPDRTAPTLEEVLRLPDATLVTFDNNAGLYTFRFDAEHPAPAPEPWPITPVHPR